MCGIYGIFSKNKNKVILKKKAENALQLIKHRGPDDCRIITTDNFSAGVNRLSIEAISNGRIFEVSTHHEDSDSYRVIKGDSQIDV